MFGAKRTLTVNRVHGAATACSSESCSSDSDAAETEIVIQNEKLHGNGVFSNVYRAVLVSPVKMPIAIKKIWRQKASPEAAKREVDLLAKVNHPCVVKLLYTFQLGTGTDTCDCLVMDFLPADLLKLRNSQPGRRLDLLDAKLYAFQMFAGVDHINAKGITHCDLKPSNLIVDERLGLLKVADFGNARQIKPDDKLESYQVTRYYRAPELVFKCNNFGPAVDRWSCGCVMAELVMGKPLLQGRDSNEQGRIIIEVLGYPNTEQVKAMRVPRPRFSRKTARGLKPLVAGYNFPEFGVDLLEKLLVYEPAQRLSLDKAMTHKYFDDLRVFPTPTRKNGRALPPLNFWDQVKSTQPDTSSRK